MSAIMQLGQARLGEKKGIPSGLSLVETVRIANGQPFFQSIQDGKRLRTFLRRLNGELSGKGLPKLDENGSLKGRLISNREFDSIFFNYQHVKIPGAFPSWSGLALGYVQTNSKLGKEIIGFDNKQKARYIFPVPTEFQGEKNAAITVRHGFSENGTPFYSYENDGKDYILVVSKEAEVLLCRNFPMHSGKYPVDNVTELPFDLGAIQRESSKFLARSIRESYVGNIVRGAVYVSRSGIGAYTEPSMLLGSLIEI